VADWAFGPDRSPHVRNLQLPPGVVSSSGKLTLVFEVSEPRTPWSLGWSGDRRPLGIRLAAALFGSGQIHIPDFGGMPAPGGLLRQMQRVLTKTVALFRAAARGRG
jgi:hypothetical protein